MSPHHQDRTVVVVGGGLVGLCCAYYLRREGFDVTVLERHRVGSGASRGNAGEICPSVAQPLAAPGVTSTALAGLNRPNSALYIHPIVDARLVRFFMRLLAHSSRRHYRDGVAGLARLARGTLDRFEELRTSGVEIDINKRGYLYVFSGEESARKAKTLVESLGASVTTDGILDPAAMAQAEPCLGEASAAGFEIENEWTIDPSAFVDQLAAYLRRAGVRIVEDARVTDIEEGAECRVRTSEGDHAADEVVVAAGVWSGELCRQLGVGVDLVAGKGYSFSVPFKEMPTRLVKLEDARVAVTPMDGHVRVAGTMEFDRDGDRFNARRIDAIVRAASPYLRGVDWDQRSAEWVGPRPMTPDGLPLIGRVPGSERITLAAGHNMLGLTLGPSTGAMVADLLMHRGTVPQCFRPARFGRRVKSR